MCDRNYDYVMLRGEFFDEVTYEGEEEGEGSKMDGEHKEYEDPNSVDSDEENEDERKGGVVLILRKFKLPIGTSDDEDEADAESEMGSSKEQDQDSYEVDEGDWSVLIDEEKWIEWTIEEVTDPQNKD